MISTYLINIKLLIIHLVTICKRLHLLSNWHFIMSLGYWINLLPDITFFSTLILILSFFHGSFFTKEYKLSVDFMAHTIPFYISLYISRDFTNNIYKFEYLWLIVIYLTYMKFNLISIKNIYAKPFSSKINVNYFDLNILASLLMLITLLATLLQL